MQHGQKCPRPADEIANLRLQTPTLLLKVTPTTVTYVQQQAIQVVRAVTNAGC